MLLNIKNSAFNLIQPNCKNSKNLKIQPRYKIFKILGMLSKYYKRFNHVFFCIGAETLD